MAAVTTNLTVFNPVFLPPSSTRNPRRLHGINQRLPSRLSFPAKPSPSLSIRIAASSPSPLTPLFPTTRSSTLTWSTRSSTLPWSTRSSTLPWSTRSSRLTRSSAVTGLARSSALAGSSRLSAITELTRSSSTTTELTRSLATLAALAMAVARALAHKLSLAAHPGGSVFFASLREMPPGYLLTPQTVVAVVLKKWLDIYSDVLALRLLLGWFPNLPWERQPLSAVRDMCDPYLVLFRDIIPPIYDIDLSSVLALAVLGTLRSILDVNLG